MLQGKQTRRERERHFILCWNLYHPESLRPIPAFVEIERVPRDADALDCLLAIWIMQAMLDP